MMGVLEDAVSLLRRGVAALERIADAVENRSGASVVEDDGEDGEGDRTESPSTPTSDVAVPSLAGGQSTTTLTPAMSTGSAHGISNMRYYLHAPGIVRRLLRDEKSIRVGVMTTTLDHELNLSAERRTRLLHRLSVECGLWMGDAPRGMPRRVRVADVAVAQKWLKDFERATTASANEDKENES